MTPAEYVCPQCGPDPRGAEEHARARHTVGGLLAGLVAEPEEKIACLRAELLRIAELEPGSRGAYRKFQHAQNIARRALVELA